MNTPTITLDRTSRDKLASEKLTKAIAKAARLKTEAAARAVTLIYRAAADLTRAAALTASPDLVDLANMVADAADRQGAISTPDPIEDERPY